ncbi:TPA: tail fiber domain-containing protein [Citrobacter braakii]|nr:tail fiber domain-containing protein [Citrobacter braakii]
MMEVAYTTAVGVSMSFIRRRLDGNMTGQIAITLPNTAGVLALQGTSGRDYKTDIHPADSAEALDRILSLELVNYVYKDDEQNRQRFGIIAEDAEKIAPQYIKHNQEPVPGTEVFDDEGNKTGEQYRDRPSIDNNPIVMDLLGSIQNLQAQITKLKDGMAALQK